jgi:hypothetical protein
MRKPTCTRPPRGVNFKALGYQVGYRALKLAALPADPYRLRREIHIAAFIGLKG